jgi:excisionase family DNA binding protein
MTDERRLAYGINDAAVQIGVSSAMIYKLIATGKLKAVKIGTRTVIPAKALHALLEKGVS